MDIKIMRLVVGPLQENCYIVYNSKKSCVIVDPGYESENISHIIDENGLKVEYILISHGHLDHVSACKDLKDKYNINVYIHNRDKEMLENPSPISATMYGMKVKACKADLFVKDGDTIKFSDQEFLVLESPGHTGGSVCYKLGNFLFTGDTLFQGTIGRYDFPESSGEELFKSLKKLIKLPKDTIVLPGHGDPTTIGDEIKYNPFLQRL